MRRVWIGIGMLALLLATTAARVGPAADAAVPNCQGVKATLVIKASEARTEGTPGDDVVVGSAGEDVFVGNGVNDLVCLGDGDDKFLPGRDGPSTPGSDGVDLVFGGRGSDALDGGAGDDRLVGGRGNDIIRGNDGADVCEGGRGTDTLGVGCETVIGVP